MVSQETKKDIKFVYFAPGDIQISRVDRQCIVYFCEALNNIGVDIELVTMGIKLLDSEVKANNPLDLYRIKNYFPFKVIKTPVNQLSNGYWWAINRFWVHAIQALKILYTEDSEKQIIFYSKNYGPACTQLLIRSLSRKKILSVFEAHVPPQNSFQQFVLEKMDFIIANSYALGEDLLKTNPNMRKKIMGIHQGVDLRLYDQLRISKAEARERIGLPVNKKLAVYTGKVYWGYKEVDYILKAAELLSGDIEVVIVGGRKDAVDRLREYVKEKNLLNVRLISFVPPNFVQYYQLAADALLLYYPTGDDLNSYRSPGKLFEYMASGRPIVAVDFPVLREVLGSTAIFVRPDSPDLLAQAIAEILADEKKAEAMAKYALSLVGNYTWEERARRIMQFLGGGDT